MYLKNGGYIPYRTNSECAKTLYKNFLDYTNDFDKSMEEKGKILDRWFDYASVDNNVERLFVRFGYICAITITECIPTLQDEMLKSQKRFADKVSDSLSEGEEWKKKDT